METDTLTTSTVYCVQEIEYFNIFNIFVLVEFIYVRLT